MVTFTDGPAAGESLSLRRAPRFLRVTRFQRSGWVWDALDQFGDEPNPCETLYAYERVGEANYVHMRMSPRSASGFYAMASYHFVPEQPSDQVMRDTDSWRAWCGGREDPDRAAFWKMLKDDPTDETARLVFADWLEEHDESQLAKRLRAGPLKGSETPVNY